MTSLINLTAQVEHDLIEQAILLSTMTNTAWEQQCNEFIETLEEQSRTRDYRSIIDNH